MARKKQAIKEFDSYDKWAIGIYLMVSAIIVYHYNVVTRDEDKGKVMYWYAFGTQFFLYFFNYKGLRKPRVYLVWCLVGIAHLAVYFILKENKAFHFQVVLFRNTIILLLFYQLLRLISFSVQGMDVAVGKLGATDMHNDRKITLFDLLLTFVYMAAVVGLLLIG